MDELIIKLREFGDPSALSVVQLLRLLEVLKIQMVRVNDRLVGVSMKIVSPFPKSSHYSEELSIIDFISSFRWIKGL